MQNAATIAGLGFGNSNTVFPMRWAIRPARSFTWHTDGPLDCLAYSLAYITSIRLSKVSRIRSNALRSWPGLWVSKNHPLRCGGCLHRPDQVDPERDRRAFEFEGCRHH